MAQRNQKLGRLVRGAVKAIAGFEQKNIALIEEELAEQIGIAPLSFPHLYVGRLSLNQRTYSVIAEAGARRGYLSRAWGQALLEHAPYSDTLQILDRLWPRELAATPTLPGRQHNLPAVTYGIFVMRDAPFAATAEALRSRSPLVALVSIGGMGKTSLARELAGRCLDPGALANGLPRFEAAVWISDKDRPGATSLDAVLDTVANTLGYPSLSRLELADRCREVGQLLRALPTLIVVDNFETVGDEALLGWLLALPEPSKALITTRVYRPEFQRGAWVVPLDGMGAAEARQLIAVRSRQLGRRVEPSAGEQQALIARTGGNPRAIELLLGLAQRTGSGVRTLLEQLHTADGRLFDELYRSAWAALAAPARRLLLALADFPDSVADETLARVADLAPAAFAGAVAQLVDLALVETAQPDDEAPLRRSLHPLTRQFAAARLAEDAAFAAATAARRTQWALEYLDAHGGYRPEAIRALQAAVAPEEPALWATLQQAYAAGDDAAVIRLALGLEFYYYINLLWGRKLALHELAIAAARRAGDVAEEVNALSLHIQLLSRQGRLQLAAPFMPRLLELGQAHAFTGWPAFNLRHTRGLYHLGAGELSAAAEAWRSILTDGAALVLPSHTRSGAEYWLARTLLAQGAEAEAAELLAASLAGARERGAARWVARNQIELANLDVRAGRIGVARARLEESRAHTEQLDDEQLAHLEQTTASLLRATGERSAAADHLRAAIERFERMGLAAELAAAREALAELTMF